MSRCTYHYGIGALEDVTQLHCECCEDRGSKLILRNPRIVHDDYEYEYLCSDCVLETQVDWDDRT